MKPPRKPTGRVPKQSSSHSRTHSRPTTRYATHSSPLHRFAGFGVSATGTEAGDNVAFQGESIHGSSSERLWCRDEVVALTPKAFAVLRRLIDAMVRPPRGGRTMLPPESAL